MDENIPERRNVINALYDRRTVSVFGLVVMLTIILGGCQRSEPVLNPAQKSFKQDMRETIDRITTGISAPLSRRDVKGTQAKLMEVMPDNAKLCGKCPFRVAVLDRNAIGVAACPHGPNQGKDFSNYDTIQKVPKNRRIAQKELYFQDGGVIYAIVAPILAAQEVVGVLTLALTQEDIKRYWDLSPQEYSQVDLNR